jgi:hypothetical protein
LSNVVNVLQFLLDISGSRLNKEKSMTYSKAKLQEIGMDKKNSNGGGPLIVNYPKCLACPLGLVWMAKRWTPF